MKADRPALTRQFRKWDKEYIWHPFTQMKDWLEDEPLVIDRADGCYLIDTDGNRYLDGVSSLWVNVHGHRRKEIDAALNEQINKLSHSTLLGLANTASIELAQKLVEIAPGGLQKVFYSDNGSTAVEVALKMSYQYWQNTGRANKKMIVHLANSYHGDTLGSVSVGGIELFHKVYRDLIFKTISFDTLNDLDKLEELFEKSHEEMAAFIVEPLIQGAAGMLLWPQHALRRIRELCTKYEILLIADEVATGFGRTGKMFACEHESVHPDILCLAKGLTGGYLPLAATLTKKKIFDGFLFDHKEQKTFFHGHTYTGNPLACAAALANLKIFEKDNTLKKLAPKIEFLRDGLRAFRDLSHVVEVRQLGMMVGIELGPFAWEERMGVKVCQKARERGVILRPLGNVIVLMPSLVISIEELKFLLDTIRWAIEEVL
ncbi:MAG: adenosylmethionine--8-amino-7-oxononanoate transaminase [Omnitrophica WOR_2 bacterium GWA2_47_8]|nr:MAG: adenosylmethionine--8-amino-7-oxononanoate transaminase [Omnitrophica WOR_2 bacterium GWA2_47_8]